MWGAGGVTVGAPRKWTRGRLVEAIGCELFRRMGMERSA